MNCKYCDNTLPNDAGFCNKCGKPVETEKPKMDIEKVKKKLKNIGNSVYAVGWLTIIINIGLYLWSILDKNFAELGLPAPDLSGAFLMVVAASIFIILGNRIKALVDKNIKLYLQILLVLSLLLFVWLLSTNGRVGIPLFLIVAYLISSLVSVRKAMKVEEFTSTLTSPKYRLDKKGWIIFAVVAVVLFFVFVGIDVSRQGSGDYSTAELVTETVKQVKAIITLPSKLDEVTTWADVTAEPSAIRYHYVLSGVDTSKLSNDYLKNYLGSSICQDKDTKNLLDQGINMEYSYVIENATETYFVSFTRADCLQ